MQPVIDLRGILPATASVQGKIKQQQCDAEQLGADEEGRARGDAARRGSEVGEPRGVARGKDGECTG